MPAPFAAQLDLPAGLIAISDGAGGQFKVMGQAGVLDAGISVFITNTAEPDRAMFCPGAGEFNGLVAGQAFGFEHIAALNDSVLSVGF